MPKRCHFTVSSTHIVRFGRYPYMYPLMAKRNVTYYFTNLGIFSSKAGVIQPLLYSSKQKEAQNKTPHFWKWASINTHIICPTTCMTSSSCHDTGTHVRAKGIFFVDTDSKTCFSKLWRYSTEFRTRKQKKVTQLCLEGLEITLAKMFSALENFISQLQRFHCTIVAIAF